MTEAPPVSDAPAPVDLEGIPETPPAAPRVSAPPALRTSTPDAPTILDVRSLTKRYGDVTALSGLDLSVRQGEVYGFLGRNGAGKSTTIRILMGITERSGGTIALFGEPLGRDVVRARQRIGYVAQEQSFYGWMTPMQLASFVASFYPSWDGEEFRRLTRRLDLETGRKIQTFSGGMRVKTALAIALAHRPPLLLLDEPTAGLDPVARREFLEIVRDESRSSGRTTFFSSHLVDEVELVAHRVGIVDGGRMRYEGSVRALEERVRLVTTSIAVNVEPAIRSLEALGFRVLHNDATGEHHRLFVESDDPARFDAIPRDPMLAMTVTRLPLEEIFIAMVRRAPRAE